MANKKVPEKGKALDGFKFWGFEPSKNDNQFTSAAGKKKPLVVRVFVNVKNKIAGFFKDFYAAFKAIVKEIM